MDKRLRVEKLIVYIDHEVDERAGSVGADSIAGIGIVTSSGEVVTDGLVGQYFMNIGEKGILDWAKRQGYAVDKDTEVEEQ
jgi:hypothetical protein